MESTGVNLSASESVPLSRFRRFPIALYFYVFGATGMGFSVAVAVESPSVHTLIWMLIACTMTLIGYFMMRPYMRLAKQAIKEHATPKLPVFEEQKNDVVS